MLRWALIFLIVALLAGALGFWEVAIISVTFAKFLFILFIVLALLTLIINFTRRVPRD